MLVFVALLAAAISSLYLWCRHRYSYWQRHGIPYIEPRWLIGNTGNALTLKRNYGLYVSDIYNESKMAKEAVVGMYIFHQPGLVIRDLDLIKSILIKDFNYFANRNAQTDPHIDALAAYNLFFARESIWRDIRNKISPVFTSGKIKQMYPLMLDVTTKLEEHLSSKKDQCVMNVKNLTMLFNIDMIATIAFGINANALIQPNGEFHRQCQSMFKFTFARSIDFSISFFLPHLTKLLRTRVFPREFANFIRNTITHVMMERERSGHIRNDLIDILVALKVEAAAAAKISDAKHFANDNDVLVAQAAVFLTAGFETSSSTIAFALYELARNPHLQDRLRQEIHDALIIDKGKLSYETLHSLEYLDMVVSETLRLYPVLPFLDRQHITPEHGKPGFSLAPHYNYQLSDNIPIYIPVFAIQRDEKYWPNPNIFDPERFSATNKANITPNAYMPFGLGPHKCIGVRIGLLQTKLGLVHILKNHMVSVCKETPVEPSFDPKALVLQFPMGVPLELKRDNLYSARV